MDWDKLRIFQAVADAGSFTHAGEALKLSQSAISRQIGALEEQLGVMLFHRHARGLILTEQGELLYRTARDMASKVNTAEALLRANHFTASNAAKQPVPAAVTAWRKILSCTSPAAHTPSTSVAVESGLVRR